MVFAKSWAILDLVLASIKSRQLLFDTDEYYTKDEKYKIKMEIMWLND